MKTKRESENMSDNVRRVMDICRGLSVEELREINHQVVEMLKTKRNIASLEKRDMFQKGDLVVTTGRKSGELGVGVIHKVNRTQAIVSFGKFGMYNVPMNIIEKAPAGSKRPKGVDEDGETDPEILAGLRGVV